MATSALISAREYLATSYRPDCDFVDGEVQPRNLGKLDHGSLQFAVAKLLDMMRREWHIRVTPGLSVQVRADRFRVPDVWRDLCRCSEGTDCAASTDAVH